MYNATGLLDVKGQANPSLSSYCKVSLGRESFVTDTMDGTCEPSWDTMSSFKKYGSFPLFSSRLCLFTFLVKRIPSRAKEQVVFFSIYDKKKRKIASADVPLRNAVFGKTINVPLFVKGKAPGSSVPSQSGTVRLSAKSASNLPSRLVSDRIVGKGRKEQAGSLLIELRLQAPLPTPSSSAASANTPSLLPSTTSATPSVLNSSSPSVSSSTAGPSTISSASFVNSVTGKAGVAAASAVGVPVAAVVAAAGASYLKNKIKGSDDEEKDKTLNENSFEEEAKDKKSEDKEVTKKEVDNKKVSREKSGIPKTYSEMRRALGLRVRTS